MHYGYVYALLLSNKTVKFGRTTNLCERFKEHERAAKAHGVSVIKFIFSERMRFYEAAESKMIAMACEVGSIVSGNEYFSGISKDEATGIVSSVCSSPVVSEGVFMRNGKLCAEIELFQKSQSGKHKASIAERAVKAIEKLGEPGFGMIKNRLRGCDDDTLKSVLQKLSEDGIVESLEKEHPKNGTLISAYRLIHSSVHKKNF